MQTKIMKGIKRVNARGDPASRHSKQGHLKQIKGSFTYWLVNKWNV